MEVIPGLGTPFGRVFPARNRARWRLFLDWGHLSGECSQPGTEPGGGYSWTGDTFRESVPSQEQSQVEVIPGLGAPFGRVFPARNRARWRLFLDWGHLSGECSQPGTEPGGGYSWTGDTFRESVPSQEQSQVEVIPGLGAPFGRVFPARNRARWRLFLDWGHLSGECPQPGTEPGGGYSWTGDTFRESVPSQEQSQVEVIPGLGTPFGRVSPARNRARWRLFLDWGHLSGECPQPGTEPGGGYSWTGDTFRESVPSQEQSQVEVIPGLGTPFGRVFPARNRARWRLFLDWGHLSGECSQPGIKSWKRFLCRYGS